MTYTIKLSAVKLSTVGNILRQITKLFTPFRSLWTNDIVFQDVPSKIYHHFSGHIFPVATTLLLFTMVAYIVRKSPPLKLLSLLAFVSFFHEITNLIDRKIDHIIAFNTADEAHLIPIKTVHAALKEERLHERKQPQHTLNPSIDVFPNTSKDTTAAPQASEFRVPTPYSSSSLDPFVEKEGTEVKPTLTKNTQTEAKPPVITKKEDIEVNSPNFTEKTSIEELPVDFAENSDIEGQPTALAEKEDIEITPPNFPGKINTEELPSVITAQEDSEEFTPMGQVDKKPRTTNTGNPQKRKTIPPSLKKAIGNLEKPTYDLSYYLTHPLLYAAALAFTGLFLPCYFFIPCFALFGLLSFTLEGPFNEKSLLKKNALKEKYDPEIVEEAYKAHTSQKSFTDRCTSLLYTKKAITLFLGIPLLLKSQSPLPIRLIPSITLYTLFFANNYHKKNTGKDYLQTLSRTAYPAFNALRNLIFSPLGIIITFALGHASIAKPWHKTFVRSAKGVYASLILYTLATKIYRHYYGPPEKTITKPTKEKTFLEKYATLVGSIPFVTLACLLLTYLKNTPLFKPIAVGCSILLSPLLYYGALNHKKTLHIITQPLKKIFALLWLLTKPIRWFASSFPLITLIIIIVLIWWFWPQKHNRLGTQGEGGSSGNNIPPPPNEDPQSDQPPRKEEDLLQPLLCQAQPNIDMSSLETLADSDELTFEKYDLENTDDPQDTSDPFFLTLFAYTYNIPPQAIPRFVWATQTLEQAVKKANAPPDLLDLWHQSKGALLLPGEQPIPGIGYQGTLVDQWKKKHQKTTPDNLPDTPQKKHQLLNTNLPDPAEQKPAEQQKNYPEDLKEEEKTTQQPEEQENQSDLTETQETQNANNSQDTNTPSQRPNKANLSHTRTHIPQQERLSQAKKRKDKKTQARQENQQARSAHAQANRDKQKQEEEKKRQEKAAQEKKREENLKEKNQAQKEKRKEEEKTRQHRINEAIRARKEALENFEDQIETAYTDLPQAEIDKEILKNTHAQALNGQMTYHEITSAQKDLVRIEDHINLQEDITRDSSLASVCVGTVKVLLDEAKAFTDPNEHPQEPEEPQKNTPKPPHNDPKEPLNPQPPIEEKPAGSPPHPKEEKKDETQNIPPLPPSPPPKYPNRPSTPQTTLHTPHTGHTANHTLTNPSNHDRNLSLSPSGQPSTGMGRGTGGHEGHGHGTGRGTGGEGNEGAEDRPGNNTDPLENNNTGPINRATGEYEGEHLIAWNTNFNEQLRGIHKINRKKKKPQNTEEAQTNLNQENLASEQRFCTAKGNLNPKKNFNVEKIKFKASFSLPKTSFSSYVIPSFRLSHDLYPHAHNAPQSFLQKSTTAMAKANIDGHIRDQGTLNAILQKDKKIPQNNHRNPFRKIWSRKYNTARNAQGRAKLKQAYKDTAKSIGKTAAISFSIDATTSCARAFVENKDAIKNANSMGEAFHILKKNTRKNMQSLSENITSTSFAFAARKSTEVLLSAFGVGGATKEVLSAAASLSPDAFRRKPSTQRIITTAGKVAVNAVAWTAGNAVLPGVGGTFATMAVNNIIPALHKLGRNIKNSVKKKTTSWWPWRRR